MISFRKVLWLQLFFFLGLPILAGILAATLGLLGVFIFQFLFVIWCWELFAFGHYRFCRQEELLYLFQTAAATKAPVESVLHAYLSDRPKEFVYRGILSLFVFPGYYWIHQQTGFDARIKQLADMLDEGIPLDRALTAVPGIASREIALAVTVGQSSDRLTESLHRLPTLRLGPQWLEMAPRLAYPLMVFMVLLSNAAFLMIFIVPKFEKIFLEFKMKLPLASEILISFSRWFAKYPWVLLLFSFVLLIAFNVLALSSRARWNVPPISWIYRLYARGNLLQMLGLMLETERPLTPLLDRVLDSGLLPTAVAVRVDGLAEDVSEGRPFAPSLLRHGLATRSMMALIEAAEKAHNLPWALRELGETLNRRSATLSYRISMVAFPLAIFGTAIFVAFFALAMFMPLTTLLRGLGG